MGSRRESPSPTLPLFWVLLAVSAGALVGIGLASTLLGRKDLGPSEDPDAPLFI